MTDQSSFVILKVLEPLIYCLGCGGKIPRCFRCGLGGEWQGILPSGVWNMPALPKSSLVGLAPEFPPGLGDGGGIAPTRADGPIEARCLVSAPTGEGEGLGLVEGGRSVAIA
jgi:hypothetical protein